MPRITMEEQPEYSVLPVDSIVLLKIEDIEVVEVTGGRSGSWQKLSFTFKCLDLQATGDGSPRENYEDVISGKMWGSVPFKLTDSPENKLRQWIEAIYGTQLSVGFELDTDLLLNKTVRGITSQYKTKAGYQRHQVDSLLPYGQSSAAPTAPMATQPDPWANEGGSQVVGYDDEPPF